MTTFLLAALLTLHSHALAQPPAATEAQRLTERARAEVAAGRLAEARDLLQQSLTLERSPTTAFNLGLVMHDLGQLVASRDLLERVLAGEYGTLPADRVARTQEMIRTITPRIGTLLCTVRGAPETEVWVDGARAGVALDGSALRIPVDPGDHALRFAATGRSAIERQVQVDPGVVVPLSVAFPREIPAAVQPAEPPPTRAPRVLAPDGPGRDRDEGGGSVFASPWLWVAVAVIAAGVTISVVLLSSPGAEQDTSVPPGFIRRVETLR
jgi:hypothetical protein